MTNSPSPSPKTGLLRTASFTAKRMRKCKVCRSPFPPRSMTHKVCSGECGKALVETERKTRERKADKIRRDKLKTRSDHMKAAQVAFNAFIRERDKDRPCISSGRPLQAGAIGGGFDAGHYRSVGSAPHLRFDERNCHGQSKHDNNYLSGNAVDYRIGLIKRIGLESVEALECDQAFRKWTDDDLIEIRVTYKRKLKELKAC